MSVRRRCRVMSLHQMQLQFHPRGVGAPLLWCSVAALVVTLLIRVLAFECRGPSLIAPHRCSPATCTTQQGPLIRPALFFDRLGDSEPRLEDGANSRGSATGDRGL